MIHEIDEALRQLLIKEMPIRNNEVDVTFDPPTREVTARWNKPTINIFLHDLRQNKYRQKQWAVARRNGNTSVHKKRTDLKFDLHYVITVWSEQPDDEHYILTRSIMALCRYGSLPRDVLPKRLQATLSGNIPLTVADPEDFLSPADLWSSVDNELRPVIACTLTLPLNPYAEVEMPLVRSRELNIGPMLGSGESEQLANSSDAWPPTESLIYNIEGDIHTKQPLSNLQLQLFSYGEENGITIPLDNNKYALKQLKAGEYVFQFSATDYEPLPYRVLVPDPINTPQERYDEELQRNVWQIQQDLDLDNGVHHVSGVVKSKQPVKYLELTVLNYWPDGRPLYVPIEDENRYVIDRLVEGHYTFQLTTPNYPTIRYKIHVKSGQHYDLDLD